MSNLEERNYYLAQFHQVADQRLKVFGFYVLLTVASLGWLASVMGQASHEPTLIITFAAGQVYLALFFHLLDRRNQQILRRAREALVFLEGSLPEPVLRTFSFKADKRSLVRFSNLFRATFILQILLAATLIYISASTEEPRKNQSDERQEGTKQSGD